MSYLNKPDKYTIYFAPDNDKIVRQDGNIETILKLQFHQMNLLS